MTSGTPEGNVSAQLATMSQKVFHETVGAYQKRMQEAAYLPQSAFVDYLQKANNLADSGIKPTGYDQNSSPLELSRGEDITDRIGMTKLPQEMVPLPTPNYSRSCTNCYH